MSGKRRLIAILIPLAAITAAAAAFALNAPLRFAVIDRLTRLGTAKRPEKIDVPTYEASVEDLILDPRISFDQSMMLINTDHPLPEGFIADAAEYKETGVIMNPCAVESFGKLSEEIGERFGEKLYVSSAFRSAKEQLEIIGEEGETAQQVGASEHQAGLGIDVYVMYFAGTGFIKSAPGKWINTNCGDYGFIIRYPYFKRSETGIPYEPWHIRYVGLPHSEIIMRNAMTLEGYIDFLDGGGYYGWQSGGKNWAVSRQSGGVLNIPESFISGTISPDNTGGYILTFEIA